VAEIFGDTCNAKRQRIIFSRRYSEYWNGRQDLMDECFSARLLDWCQGSDMRLVLAMKGQKMSSQGLARFIDA